MKNRQQTLIGVARGMQADIADYRALRDLLQAQFEAALRHRPAELAQLARDISTLCETLEKRRVERVGLVDSCVEVTVNLPREERVMAVLLQLPASYHGLAQSVWQTLQKLVPECKALNLRNCNLMMDQHEIMQRVLNAESDIYAPL